MIFQNFANPELAKAIIDAGTRGIVPAGILDHVGNFKKYTTTQIWWKCGGTGQLWQKSNYNRVIRYNKTNTSGGEN